MVRSLLRLNGNHMTTTILIATNHAGNQLVQTVRSIRKSHGMRDVPILILADTLSVASSVQADLKRLDCSLFWQKSSTTQAHKYATLLKRCKSSHVILTQDDVLFDPDTLQATLRVLETAPETTMVGVRNTPLPAHNFLERTISMGTIISNTAAITYNHADNYLACMGRVMTFPTAWLRTLSIPHDAVALDAYLYFQNRAHGGKYRFLSDQPVYFRSPNTLSEHRAKGERFRSIPTEMNTLGLTIEESSYAIPLKSLIAGVLRAASIDIVATGAYLLLMIVTMMVPFPQRMPNKNNAWAADVSTKDLGVE